MGPDHGCSPATLTRLLSSAQARGSRRITPVTLAKGSVEAMESYVLISVFTGLTTGRRELHARVALRRHRAASSAPSPRPPPRATPSMTRATPSTTRPLPRLPRHRRASHRRDAGDSMRIGRSLSAAPALRGPDRLAPPRGARRRGRRLRVLDDRSLNGVSSTASGSCRSCSTTATRSSSGATACTSPTARSFPPAAGAALAAE